MIQLNNHKKKYIIITGFFPNEKSFRGPFVFDQAKALEAVGSDEVIVFKPYSVFSRPQKDYIYEGINVYRFPHFRLPFMLFPGIFDKLSQWFFLKKLRSMGVKYEEISCCHSHTMIYSNFANLLKKKSQNVKTIAQYHHFDVLALKGLFSKKYKWHLDYAIRYATKISNEIDLHIGVSNKVIECFNEYPNIKLKNTYVLYNGVNTSIFRPDTNHKKNHDYFHIGCIANFKIFKGHMTLIKAIQELVCNRNINIKATLIGSGETRSECEQYCTDNNLTNNFIFQNEVQHKFLPEFYHTLDLYVMPAYWETFGCVYTEAYSCGIPFIACEDQGICELLEKDDYSKWLIKPHDYMELANKIENYILNRPLLKINKPIEINVLVSSYLAFLSHLNLNSEK